MLCKVSRLKLLADLCGVLAQDPGDEVNVVHRAVVEYPATDLQVVQGRKWRVARSCLWITVYNIWCCHQLSHLFICLPVCSLIAKVPAFAVYIVLTVLIVYFIILSTDFLP